MRYDDQIIGRLWILLSEAVKRLPGRTMTVELDEYDIKYRYLSAGSAKPEDVKLITQRDPKDPQKLKIKVMLQGDYEKEVAKRPNRVFDFS